MRIKKLQKHMQEKNIDLCLFLSFNNPNTNTIYYSDYHGKGILAVTKNKHFLLIPRYEENKINNKKTKVYFADKTKLLIDELKKHITKVNKIGIEDDKITVYIYKKIKKKIKGKYYDISEKCREIRMKKEVSELKKIKKACSVTDSVFKKICNNFKFKTEDEIRNFIKKEFEKNNCDLAFPPIAASAEGTSKVHYDGSKKFKKGFLMLDFGAKYKGYCADMTRMLYIGKPSKKELEKFNLVKKTILKCENNVLNKKNYGEIHDLAIDMLGDDSEYFTHYLGHGLGLDIHESPSLEPENKTKITKNVPFTIEPGIYFPEKFGIRIEDTVIIENNKLNILTKSKKELVIVK